MADNATTPLLLEEPEPKPRVKVLIPLPLVGPYDYAVQAELTLQPGDYVSVPLGNRTVNGVVWDPPEGDENGGIAEGKVKDVLMRLPVPGMPDELRQFIEWVAHYTCNPLGAVLRLAMRGPNTYAAPKPRIAFAPTGSEPKRLTPARKRVLDTLSETPPLMMRDVSTIAGVSTSVVKGLVKDGALEEISLPGDVPFPKPDPKFAPTELTDDQTPVADALRRAVSAQAFEPSLLDGVTGSGKTEVYFEAIAQAIEDGRQALILLPEIALTVQFLERFEKRFGCRPAQWHSDVKPNDRRRTWRAVAMGDVDVVVGARSALFLPFSRLGLIIVDEEHDSSFKQEDGVIYGARDMAIVRAQIANVPIVLASATPSLETIANARGGRYSYYKLPTRHGGAEMPEVRLIDLREDPPDRQTWLSPTLTHALIDAFSKGEQALLFLNRRGYAPLTLCRTCGHRLHCPHCSAWLVQHRFRRKLMCHHCGYEQAQPKACPECGDEDSLAPCGPGVERIAEEVADKFPDQVTEILSSDRIWGPAALQEILDRMQSGDIDLLIGTQIVAKGHHFPGLTVVGVVDADLGLEGGDPRASERTFQLLAQVAGRAGRANKRGTVYVQTRQPDHPVLQALARGDRDGFLSQELRSREYGGLPPHGRLVSLIVSGPDKQSVVELADHLARIAPRGNDIYVLGPAEAPIALLRGRHRMRLLVKAARHVNVQAFMAQWLETVKLRGGLKLAIDVDPYSFF